MSQSQSSQSSNQNQNPEPEPEPVETDEIKQHRQNLNDKLMEMFEHGQLYKTYTREKYQTTIKELQLAKTEPDHDHVAEKVTEIRNNHGQANRKITEQAERMINRAKHKCPPAAIGDNVQVPIPDVDKGPSTFNLRSC